MSPYCWISILVVCCAVELLSNNLVAAAPVNDSLDINIAENHTEHSTAEHPEDLNSEASLSEENHRKDIEEISHAEEKEDSSKAVDGESASILEDNENVERTHDGSEGEPVNEVHSVEKEVEESKISEESIESNFKDVNNTEELDVEVSPHVIHSESNGKFSRLEEETSQLTNDDIIRDENDSHNVGDVENHSGDGPPKESHGEEGEKFAEHENDEGNHDSDNIDINHNTEEKGEDLASTEHGNLEIDSEKTANVEKDHENADDTVYKNPDIYENKTNDAEDGDGDAAFLSEDDGETKVESKIVEDNENSNVINDDEDNISGVESHFHTGVDDERTENKRSSEVEEQTYLNNSTEVQDSEERINEVVDNADHLEKTSIENEEGNDKLIDHNIDTDGTLESGDDENVDKVGETESDKDDTLVPNEENNHETSTSQEQESIKNDTTHENIGNIDEFDGGDDHENGEEQINEDDIDSADHLEEMSTENDKVNTVLDHDVGTDTRLESGDDENVDETESVKDDTLMSNEENNHETSTSQEDVGTVVLDDGMLTSHDQGDNTSVEVYETPAIVTSHHDYETTNSSHEIVEEDLDHHESPDVEHTVDNLASHEDDNDFEISGNHDLLENTSSHENLRLSHENENDDLTSHEDGIDRGLGTQYHDGNETLPHEDKDENDNLEEKHEDDSSIGAGIDNHEENDDSLTTQEPDENEPLTTQEKDDRNDDLPHISQDGNDYDEDYEDYDEEEEEDGGESIKTEIDGTEVDDVATTETASTVDEDDEEKDEEEIVDETNDEGSGSHDPNEIPIPGYIIPDNENKTEVDNLYDLFSTILTLPKQDDKGEVTSHVNQEEQHSEGSARVLEESHKDKNIDEGFIPVSNDKDLGSVGGDNIEGSGNEEVTSVTPVEEPPMERTDIGKLPESSPDSKDSEVKHPEEVAKEGNLEPSDTENVHETTEKTYSQVTHGSGGGTAGPPSAKQMDGTSEPKSRHGNINEVGIREQTTDPDAQTQQSSTGSYIVLGVIMVIIVVLLGFAVIRSRRRRQAKKSENFGTEMKDIEKNLLPANGNGTSKYGYREREAQETDESKSKLLPHPEYKDGDGEDGENKKIEVVVDHSGTNDENQLEDIDLRSSETPVEASTNPFKTMIENKNSEPVIEIGMNKSPTQIARDHFFRQPTEGITGAKPLGFETFKGKRMSPNGQLSDESSDLTPKVKVEDSVRMGPTFNRNQNGVP